MVSWLVLVLFLRLSSAAVLVNPKNADSNGLSASALAKVVSLAQSSSSYSWELGTFAEAYTEYAFSQLSVYASGSELPPSDFGALPSTLSTIASYVMQNRPDNATAASNATGSALLTDDAAGDPASLGPLIILANLSRQSIDGFSSAEFATAATDEYNFLLNTVPRTSDGAISHRVTEVSLWSDFVYMVPPFLAYYGIATGNTSAIDAAYQQIKIYRTYLQDTDTRLWRHISMGSVTDSGLWATGNAWVAAGITRTYATIHGSSFASAYSSELSDLSAWALEVVEAAYGTVSAGQMFPNYFNDSETNSFPDASSTALMNAVVFRLAEYDLGVTNTTINKAQKSRYALYDDISSDNGQLYNVVDPQNSRVSTNGSVSPEGQSFVVLMETAWYDYLTADGQTPSRTVDPDGTSTYSPSATSYPSSTKSSAGQRLTLPGVTLYVAVTAITVLGGGLIWV